MVTDREGNIPSTEISPLNKVLSQFYFWNSNFDPHNRSPEKLSAAYTHTHTGTHHARSYV
jgi:hypothetical protein